MLACICYTGHLVAISQKHGRCNRPQTSGSNRTVFWCLCTDAKGQNNGKITVNCVMLLYTNAQGQDKAYLMARHFIVMPYCHSVHRRVRVQLDDIIE